MQSDGIRTVELSGTNWLFKEFLGEDWVWRNAHKKQTGDKRFWKPACVPGSVMEDLFKCGAVPDPYYGTNSLLSEWTSQRTWVYRRTFTVPKEMKGKNLCLCLEGIDYEALIYLNDVCLGTHTGMFTEARYDITQLQEEENLLAVVIKKSPDEQPQVSKTRYVSTHKCRMTYWWDFCPRMIHQGIWKDVRLEGFSKIYINRMTADIQLQNDYKEAHIELCAELEDYACDQGTKRIEALCEISIDGQSILCIKRETKIYHSEQKLNFNMTVNDPKLWWPNGYGNQPLYSIHMKISRIQQDGSKELCHEKTIRTGIREVIFEKNENAPADARPYTLTVNGRKIYMKGYNWVPIDVMYGVKREEKLCHLIHLAAAAHVNIFRVWGGGLIEREEFYHLCDEKGIFVWQEFIQSSSGIENKPSEEPGFLEMMEREAKEIILSVKNHPSLALWGGGNELQGKNGSMITDSEPVIAVLKKQTEIHDKTRYFLPSSPTGKVVNNTLENIKKDPEALHDVHGPWEHQGLKEQYTLYNNGTSLLSSEFGVEGMTNYKTLLQCNEPDRLWPPNRDNFNYFHRGSWWNNFPLMQQCFEDNISNIEQAVKCSQLMQYEGLKYAVEANRRRAMHSCGTFPWQFNEPYPNNTCTSSVDYYGRPKPAYYGVALAYSVSLVAASFPSQTIEGESVFWADIYFQTSLPAISCKVCADVRDSQGHCLSEAEFYVSAGNENAVCAGRIECRADEIETDIFFLSISGELNGEDKKIYNRYLFTKTTLAPLLAIPDTIVTCRRNTETETQNAMDEVRLINIGTETAVGVFLNDVKLKEEQIIFDSNYFYILPGEEKIVQVHIPGEEEPEYTVSGFNIAALAKSHTDAI